MGLFCKNDEAEEAGGQLTLKTAINQKRIIVVKLPYSDMKTLPPQVNSFKPEPGSSTFLSASVKSDHLLHHLRSPGDQAAHQTHPEG